MTYAPLRGILYIATRAAINHNSRSDFAMKYVLKVSDCDSFVEGFCIDPQCDTRYVWVDYTDNPEKALTTGNSLCIAEAQTYYKEL